MENLFNHFTRQGISYSFIFIRIDKNDIIDNNDESTIPYYAFKIYIKNFNYVHF